MRAASWSLFLLAGVLAPGCGLTLDYGPPEPDAAGVDAGGFDAGRVRRDAATAACASADDCDDGLSCTIDECLAGLCRHGLVCAGAGEECIARAGGTCANPCSDMTACDDGLPCTLDSCDSVDGHCSHESTCDDARGGPVCLRSDACVPPTCARDADCDDDDGCNGVELCVGSVCVAGEPVVCPDASPGSCATPTCVPSLGECVDVLDSARCDDSRDCTSDVCVANGGSRVATCYHAPIDALCDDGDSCTLTACRPDDPSADATTGCVVDGGVVCADSTCIASASCNPSTGMCDYMFACPTDQFCGGDGLCHPAACSGTGSCLGTSPNSCPYFCSPDSTCQPLDLCPPMQGCAVADARCALPGECHYGLPAPDVAARLCNDGDPATADTCDPSSFSCLHTCADAPSDCFSVFDDGIGGCDVIPDDTYCQAHHPSVPGCLQWVCGGALSGLPGADGCTLAPSRTLCEDGAACTNDVCIVDGPMASHCGLGPPTTICDDGIECTAETCDPMAPTHDARGCVVTRDDGACAGPLDLPLTLPCAHVICTGDPASAPRIAGSTYPAGCGLRFDPCPSPNVCVRDTGRCGPAPTACGAACEGDACSGLACVAGRCIVGPEPCRGLPPIEGCSQICTPEPGGGYSCERDRACVSAT